MTKCDERFASVTVQLLTELKFKSQNVGSPFVDEDKGQVLNYFENTFLCQPWRRTLVCILLSNFHVMVLKGRWDEGVVSVVEYLPILLTSEDAVYEIHHAMTCDLFDGDFPPEILDWAPESHISTFPSSRNATVYKYGNFVLKRLQGEENVQHERSILTELSETDNVVHLSIKDNGVSPYLVFPNVGLSFEQHRRRRERIDVEIIRGVIDTLKSIHDLGILHRDIRPANLILNFKKTKAIVIDFGLAVQLDDDEELFFEGCFVGTSIFSADDHLNDYSNDGLVYSRATDLESLVKTWVFISSKVGITALLVEAAIQAATAECVEGRTEEFKKIAECWNFIIEREKKNKYMDALSAARRGDYEELKRCIRSV